MWLKNIAFRNYYLASFILSLVIAAGIVIIRNFLPPVVPLYYGKPIGSDQLAQNILLIIVPAASIVVGVLNLTVSKFVKDMFIKRLLAIFSLLVSLLSAITIIKIVLLVGFF